LQYRKRGLRVWAFRCAIASIKIHGMSEMHVILGAGQVGTVLARELLARGRRVRQVRRGAPDGGGPSGIEWMRGDVSDAAFVADATRGAAAVYDCVNPGYDQWPTLLPPMRRSILEGVARSGAKLVQLDNVYMYGAPRGPMTEDAPVAPVSKKGELRALLAEETMAASRRGDVRVVVARASDFYGPEFVRASIFGPHFYERALTGKGAYAFGDPDAPHSYAYGPDVARGMIRLGDAGDDVLGQVWHLPQAPALSTRATMAVVGAAMGADVRVQRVPDWLLRTIGLFQPVLREVVEMTYQWKAPFVVDDSKWRAHFGDEATPLEIGAQETARWALGCFARKAA
jgi:nucleoside-diphosphate-sugar epimerase